MCLDLVVFCPCCLCSFLLDLFVLFELCICLALAVAFSALCFSNVFCFVSCVWCDIWFYIVVVMFIDFLLLV